jgi:hypothetical protein
LLPLQPGWPHLQSIIHCVFAVLEHCALQYSWSAPTWQEQFGCAHFFDSVTMMMSFLSFGNVSLGPQSRMASGYMWILDKDETALIHLWQVVENVH